MNKAVFLDRDGVIAREIGYLHRISDFQFMDGVFDTCRLLRTAGYLLFVVTNQAGIARGLYSEEDFHTVNRWMLDRFTAQAVRIERVYFCPHHPVHGHGSYRIACSCRKPEPGMIRQAAAEFALDLSKSIVVGNKLSDLEAGSRAGVGQLVLVKSGQPASSAAVEMAHWVVDSLGDVEAFKGVIRRSTPRSCEGYRC